MHTDEISNLATPDLLTELVTMAWTTFVGSDLVQVESDVDSEDLFCSSISISGPWNATLLLFCDAEVATASTAAVLGMDVAEVQAADTMDIMGELVNIVGGNLKGAVSDDDLRWKLSLPVVSQGMQAVPGSQLTTDLCFVGPTGMVGCRLHETAD